MLRYLVDRSLSPREVATRSPQGSSESSHSTSPSIRCLRAEEGDPPPRKLSPDKTLHLRWAAHRSRLLPSLLVSKKFFFAVPPQTALSFQDSSTRPMAGQGRT